MSKATGASALFGLSIDSPSDIFSIGHPQAAGDLVTAPSTALTATAGTSGNLDGSFLYRVGFGQKNGAMTTPAFTGTAVLTPSTSPAPVSDDAALVDDGFSYDGVHTWDIVIDSVGSPNKFKWRKDGGVWTTGVSCTLAASPADLSDGLTIGFGAVTGHTLGDAWQISTAVVSTVVTTTTPSRINLTAIPVRSPNTVNPIDRRVIERSDDGGLTWAIAGTLYDNTTTTFTDNTAVLDKSKILPFVNQTGSNYGYTFLEPDSFDAEPAFSMLPVSALLGTSGKPRSIPGPIKFPDSPKSDMRPADLLPILVSGAGAPDTYAQVAGEPTQIATWGARASILSPRTVSAFAHQGSASVAPNFLYQRACEELAINFSGGKIIDIAPKFTGANYGTSAPAVPLTHTGNYTGSFVALGQRYDADALTKSVFIKITDLLASNVVKFTVSVDTHASAGGGTYSTAKFNLTRNATSHKQTKAGLQYNDAIEITDQNGLNLGADVGSNRQPFVILATLPFDTDDFKVGDIYEILPTAAIPGAGAAPYSGTPARFAVGPRFTDAHVTIIQDGSVIEATSGSLTFKWPRKDYPSLGAGARTPADLPPEGFRSVDLTITRFLDSSTNQNQIRTDSRGVVRVSLEGDHIPINPGVFSTYREAFYVDLPQVAFTSVKAPVTGQVLVVETVTAEAEQPDNPANDLYNLTLQTRQAWTVPA